MQEHCAGCLHRHFCYNLFSRISLSSENKWFTQNFWFTVLELPLTTYDFMKYLMLKTFLIFGRLVYEYRDDHVSLVLRKLVFGVFDQYQHKQAVQT